MSDAIDEPLISVVIPTYNCAVYLSAAIESVLRQSYRNFEIIVIDDGSTDHTQQVVERFNGAVRYKYQKNTGLSVARNLGIDVARGEIIALLDADDVWQQRKLELQYDMLARESTIDAVFSDYQNFTEDVRHPPYFEEIGLYKNLKVEKLSSNGWRVVDPEFFQKIVRSHVILPSAFMARRACLQCVGNFEPSLRIVQDTHLWLRMLLQQCSFGFVPESLVERRLRHGSLITDQPNFVHEHIMMYHDLMRRAPLPSSNQVALLRELLDHYWYVQAYRLYRQKMAPFELRYFWNLLLQDHGLSTLSLYLAALMPNYVVGTKNTLRWRWNNFRQKRASRSAAGG